ncbi:alpha/beta-hydrolase [Rickenella mellea]|uniref:Carboxylic ester hydrolase n=1 Tax=Rickenella mellea TaxID=50990 RepID=A0A4R5XDE5_9AGAM|nr:alpha/beta-hydrolase [Rickenella mellea]
MSLIRVCVLIGASLATVNAATSSPVVNLGYAQYQGALNTTTNVTTFMGIRYASPPTGTLRFQAPQAPATVSGVQIANVIAPTCLQGIGGDSPNQPFPIQKRASPASEDCLFLNVFLPGTLSPHAKLPVIVWIHGGGYATGSMIGADGTDLIQDGQGGVVVVAIQYRLGAFGFLAGAEVKKNGVLNAGLLDQQFALQWVQKHIASFGGDHNKVTIWGESAGAGSVLQHVVAHGGRTNPSLFQKAITSSTFLPFQYPFDGVVPEAIYSAVVNQTNCTSALDTFACVQAIDASILETANNNIAFSGFEGTFVFVPVVDGSFIVERPTQTFARGTVNGQVYHGVTNSFEGANFVSTKIPLTTLTAYVTKLFPAFGPTQVSQVVDTYSNIGLNGTFNQAVGIIGECIFICPTYFMLKAFPLSHKGEFAIPPARHGGDVPYYFPGVPGFNNTAFIKSFSQSFLAVAKFGDPNMTPDPENITPQWNAYALGDTEMVFNKTDAGLPDIHPSATDPALISRCK